MVRIYTNILWNGWGAMKAKGVVIHNDYGLMTALEYEDWLRRSRVPKPSLGFAHKYIDRNTIATYVPINRKAYHTGDGSGDNSGNATYVGIEIVQSRGPNSGKITKEQFIENENMGLREAAKDLHSLGLEANRTTVKLHNQFSATSCPHYSQDIHGKGLDTQDYFIAKIKEYMKLGKTVEEMLKNEDGSIVEVIPSKPITQPGDNLYGAKLVKNEKAKYTVTAKDGIKVRNAPSTDAKHTGTLKQGQSINYDQVYEGNGYRWLAYTGSSGNRLYLPYRPTSGANEIWGYFGSAPSKTVAKKKTLHLPKSAKTWRIYRVNGPYTVGNEIHLLTPSAFGGLTYEILEEKGNHVYIINTSVKGKVAIYAGPNTPAKIS